MPASSWSEGSDGVDIEPDASGQDLILTMLSGCSKQRQDCYRCSYQCSRLLWLLCVSMDFASQATGARAVLATCCNVAHPPQHAIDGQKGDVQMGRSMMTANSEASC